MFDLHQNSWRRPEKTNVLKKKSKLIGLQKAPQESIYILTFSQSLGLFFVPKLNCALCHRVTMNAMDIFK